MRIKAGKRTLLLPYMENRDYWSRVEHRKIAFFELPYEKYQSFLVCSKCGHAEKIQESYYRNTFITCPKCGNPHSWATNNTYVPYSSNILLSSPKIITQNGEMCVSLSLYRFDKQQNDKRYLPHEFCKVTYSRAEGVSLTGVLDEKKYSIQEIDWRNAEWEEPIVRAILKAFNKVYPSSGMEEVVRAKQNLQYGFNMKVLLNYYHYLFKYPFMEQLAKAGYGHIIADIMRRSPAVINNKIKTLFQQGTREKEIMQMPGYIREYIKTANIMDEKRVGKLKELCDLEPNMSRETFELFRKAFPHYVQALYSIRILMTEAGYTLSEVCRLVLGSQDTSYSRQAIRLQLDYIRMCRQMEVPYEKFPKYVKRVHDELSAKFQVKRNEYIMKAFEHKVSEFSMIRLENSAYIIRCPESMEELIQEGQVMHHCVASYAQRFAEGSSLIFFMRKTQAPEKPYITMEFDRTGRLVQARKAYNCGIDNTEESSLIQTFRKDILIPALPKAA